MTYPNVLNYTKGLFAELAQAQQAQRPDTVAAIRAELDALRIDVDELTPTDGEEDTKRLLDEVRTLYDAGYGGASSGGGKRTTKAAGAPEAAVPPPAR